MDNAAILQALTPIFGHYAVLIVILLAGLPGIASEVQRRIPPPTSGWLAKIWPIITVLARNVGHATNAAAAPASTTPGA